MAAIDICNEALAELGVRSFITDLDAATPPAQYASLFYEPTRKELLRGAPWGFARKTIVLTELGTAATNPSTSIYPWLVKYAYPEDCLKFRYVLPPPLPMVDSEDAPDVSSTILAPWCAPSRQWRYLVSWDPEPAGDDPNRVLLSNVLDAHGVYTFDCDDDAVWDPLFRNALVKALASKMVLPLTGNVGMKADWEQLARDAVVQARAVDGNEAIPTTDHVVDWMAVRGLPPGGTSWNAPGPFTDLGAWYSGYDTFWGM